MRSLMFLSLAVCALGRLHDPSRIVEKPIKWSPEQLQAGETPIVDPPKRTAGYFKLDRTKVNIPCKTTHHWI